MDDHAIFDGFFSFFFFDIEDQQASAKAHEFCEGVGTRTSSFQQNLRRFGSCKVEFIKLEQQRIHLLVHLCAPSKDTKIDS